MTAQRFQLYRIARAAHRHPANKYDTRCWAFPTELSFESTPSGMKSQFYWCWSKKRFKQIFANLNFKTFCFHFTHRWRRVFNFHLHLRSSSLQLGPGKFNLTALGTQPLRKINFKKFLLEFFWDCLFNQSVLHLSQNSCEWWYEGPAKWRLKTAYNNLKLVNCSLIKSNCDVKESRFIKHDHSPKDSIADLKSFRIHDNSNDLKDSKIAFSAGFTRKK